MEKKLKGNLHVREKNEVVVPRSNEHEVTQPELPGRASVPPGRAPALPGSPGKVVSPALKAAGALQGNLEESGLHPAHTNEQAKLDSQWEKPLSPALPEVPVSGKAIQGGGE